MPITLNRAFNLQDHGSHREDDPLNSKHSPTLFRIPRILAVFLTISLAVVSLPAHADDEAENKRLNVAHYFDLASVGDPQISPDGDWIAYTVGTSTLDDDSSETRIWAVPIAGGDPVAMTAKKQSSSQPRWSPDGNYLSFLSSRDEGETQVWTLSRNGGEAVQVTETIQSVRSHAWSPDSKRLLLILQDPTLEEIGKQEEGEDYKAKPRPWVITRQQFKTDYVGYLDSRRKHIYVLDIDSGELSQLTSGDYDDSEATWSPDSGHIAFTSNRSEDPDLNFNTDIWTVSSTAPESGFKPLTRVTSNPGEDGAPAWSPDGQTLTHRSALQPERGYYNTHHLAVSPAGGGDLKLLTEAMDRNISKPRFSNDGQHILFSLEDSGEQILARIPAGGGSVARLIKGRDAIRGYNLGSNDEIAALITRPQQPAEVFLLQDGELQQRSFANKKLLDTLELGEVVEVTFNSADGTEIEGFIIKPPGFKKNKKYPIILDIHGGPQSQYDYGFSYDAQLLAANGYLVVHPNPRGSTGYGMEFCLAIWQAWGEPDYEDVMAAVDHAIELGWGDPDRMAVMGWSYGGMLTNHVITKTDRFKAAVTGASATLYVSNYGHDMYLRWWEQELGQPWKPEVRALYDKLSPFNKVENVVTPTLIMGGEKDWNVPIINSEQLYLALRRLGVDTELVVYPGEYHGIGTPHHNKDLYERHLAWFEKYVRAD